MIMRLISQLPLRIQALISSLLENKEVDAEAFVELSEYTKDEFFENNPDFITSNWNWGTTDINNKPVDGELLPLQDSQAVIDEIINGKRLIVNLGTRKAGTRVGIHVHQSGGTTFVVGGEGAVTYPSGSATSNVSEEGAITDYVEGYENSFNPAGSYYYMPYNTPMSASNLEDKDVLLLDVFYFPIEGEPITIIEEGYPTYDPPQYYYDAIFIAPDVVEQIITDSDIGDQEKQFEVLGNVSNLRSTKIRFDNIQNQNIVNLDRTTAGGGTIQSNIPSMKLNELSINGIYFNSDAGDDKIVGSKFNDIIRGGDGQDVIDGLEGDDVIRGGSGGDIMSGGEGSDLFYYTIDQIDNSTDVIKDFDQNGGDRLYVQNGINAFAFDGFVYLQYQGFETIVDIGTNWSFVDAVLLES